jgi:hypothetical protein
MRPSEADPFSEWKPLSRESIEGARAIAEPGIASIPGFDSDAKGKNLPDPSSLLATCSDTVRARQIAQTEREKSLRRPSPRRITAAIHQADTRCPLGVLLVFKDHYVGAAPGSRKAAFRQAAAPKSGNRRSQSAVSGVDSPWW